MMILMTLLPTLEDLLLQIDREHIPNKPVLPQLTIKTDQRLELLQTNKEEVQKLLKNLDTAKSSGPDGIGNKL